jgi:alpha 1,3-glucosidase
MRLLIPLVILAALFDGATAVKYEDFKTCSQSSFCRRLRSIGTKQVASDFTSPYSLSDSPPSTPTPGSWKWSLKSTLYPEINFELQVDILDIGVPRIRVDETGSTTPFKRYNETAKWVLLDTSPPLDTTATTSTSNGKVIIKYGKGTTLEIQQSPFKITSLRDGKPEMIINDRSLFHMEHFRIRNIEAAEELLGEGEQLVVQPDRSWFEESDHELFEEKFKKWTDSKPKGMLLSPVTPADKRGPEGLSLDITFPGVQDIYGLPEHASPLSLPDTVGDSPRYTEPYRLFNVDIFEYLADSSMALYGAIPLLHAHSSTHSIGVLNLIGSDTWVDVHHTSESVQTHWLSESGILDLLILPGPRPDDLFKQYAALAGPTPLPPHWSIAYHQCRWNYVDEEDVLEVDRRFDEADIPLDITWLDIEYAAEHRYFDWDEKVFPDPVRMLNKVADKGRKVSPIGV